ncbi:interleukin 4 family protein [Orientia chuto str. Dubai]|uniref:Interleukin 4 family protein n=1 Tax=Orientia chuto str. Dubai TaxID=1359168 RepID=A0A0F3MHZ4_9RICK|nr:CarD family transcriptional regulator [Candidatus Orientia mediorientalis]KJV55393.1 interleukin 4 family protein [Orientia chuto str. Dubai]
METKQHQQFKIGDKVVYPSHGVGEVIGIENYAFREKEFKVYVVSFPMDKMTLRVPIDSQNSSGLRSISYKTNIDKIYKILCSQSQPGNKMWSRRAQEYENKINSGDLCSIAEVVRDLYKNSEIDRSYSERSIYESALTRLARELSILESLKYEEVIEKITETIKNKNTM